MPEIHIPFQDRFREPMLNGIKIMTSRTKKYGHKGDFFRIFGAPFLLTEEPHLEQLGFIAKHFWQKEGVESEADFVLLWGQIHPYRGFDSKQLVYLHEFRRLPLEKLEGKVEVRA